MMCRHRRYRGFTAPRCEHQFHGACTRQLTLRHSARPFACTRDRAVARVARVREVARRQIERGGLRRGVSRRCRGRR